MHVKSIVSAAVLSAAMMFSGAAFAQTMLGGVEVSADDLQAVTDRCEALVTAKATESATSQSSDENAANAGDTTVDNAPLVNELEAATTTFDLDTITVEDCEAAGLGTAM